MSYLIDAIEQGNQKSAQTNREKLAELVSKDVKCGYQIPLTIEAAKKIKDRVIDSHRTTDQNTFLDMGEKVPKKRLTHDQYFCFSSGKSLNKIIPQGHLPPIL